METYPVKSAEFVDLLLLIKLYNLVIYVLEVLIINNTELELENTCEKLLPVTGPVDDLTAIPA